VAERARAGFQKGFIRGLIGMGLTGLSGGRLSARGRPGPPHRRLPTVAEYYRRRIPASEIARICEESRANGTALHSALMDRAGWPAVPFDGKLLMSHQDALLLGGKVQAPAGYADHVEFIDAAACERCGSRVCIDACSGQAIAAGPNGAVIFDREKCIYCGACLWNCSQARPGNPSLGNIELRAGAGGLHSAEN
jgi:electron-transferring-flavoprotein dehydrogenase